ARQAAGHRGLLDVRAADGIAQVQQNLGDAAHPRTADPHEMNALYAVLHAASSIVSTQASAISCAAFRPACSRACWATPASSARLRASSHAARVSAASVACGIIQPPPHSDR